MARARPLRPTGVQLTYLTELKRILKLAKRLVKERLYPRLPDLIERANPTRTDAAQPPGKRINSIFDQISEALFKRVNPKRNEGILQKIANLTAAHQRSELSKQVAVPLAVVADKGLKAAVAHFTAENVALIESLGQTYLDQVEQTVLRGMAAGTRHEDLAVEIEERYSVAEDRAKTIARDQVNKFNGSLNELRQTNLGITSFIWRTVKDSRVRSTHADLEAEEFDWSEPPENEDGVEIIPGSEINCRCFAEPVLPTDDPEISDE